MGKVSQYLNTNPILVDPARLFTLLMEEIEPVRYLMGSDTVYAAVTEDQTKTFARFCSYNMKDYKHRIPVVQAITGNPMYTSTKLMTRHVLSVLIDTMTVTVEKDGKNIWEPSEWFIDVVPGIEHMIVLEGGTCPPQFWLDGIMETSY